MNLRTPSLFKVAFVIHAERSISYMSIQLHSRAAFIYIGPNRDSFTDLSQKRNSLFGL